VAAAPGEQKSPDWRGQLLWTESRTGKARLVLHVENVVRILQLHPAWVGHLRFDEFRGRILLNDPPWNDFARPRILEPAWVDEDATRLAGWLRNEFHQYAFAPTISDCERAVDVVAHAHGFHPVREYLEALSWDGVARLATAPATYFGAEASDYTSNVFRWWLISAVARIFRPGCKADHVLILEGRQGKGKSTALRILAGEWFSDTPIDLNSKEAYAQIRGRWLVELAELDSLFRAEASRAKAFFSSSKDDYRPAYARREREQLRQCVFAGTVNEGVYLKDPTGARRFWPMVCRDLDLPALTRDRDQVWAEAVALFRQGARWWPDSGEVQALEQEQEARTERDEWADKIERYLRTVGGEVSGADILQHALGLEPRDWTRANQTRVGTIMLHGLKWAKRKQRGEAGTRWVYERPRTDPGKELFQP
jgi:putative DNA primase/helicase